MIQQLHGNKHTPITKPLTPEAQAWAGWKSGSIKPAFEPILWAYKPTEGSISSNVLKWGVGAVNVAETRISLNGNKKVEGGCHKNKTPYHLGKLEKVETNQSLGRFPANVILSHHPECVQRGVKRVKSESGGNSGKDNSFSMLGAIKPTNKNLIGRSYKDPNGLETVEAWDCHPDCAVRLLDEGSGITKTHGGRSDKQSKGIFGTFGGRYFGNNDSGGASRFFYTAKASRTERNAGLEGMEEKNQASTYGDIGSVEGNPRKPATGHVQKIKNSHPTVKPIALFEWLIKLVTREGQIILDPFLGSGTTAIAAHKAGRKCIGIEKEDEYLEIAKRRIDYWKSQPRQLELKKKR